MSRRWLRWGAWCAWTPAVATVLALGGIGSCSERSSGRISERSLVAQLTGAASAHSLSLLLVPLADTVRAGESADLAVLVINGGDSAVSFRNTAEYFYYEIRGPSGALVRPKDISEPPQLGSVPDTWLPAGGVLGRIVDTRCIHAGVRNYRPGGAGCEFAFTLQDRGLYRIRVVYVLPSTRGDTVRGDTTLVSNAAEVLVT